MRIFKALLIATLLLSASAGSVLRGQSQNPQPSDSRSTVIEEVVMVNLPDDVFLLKTKVPADEYHIRLSAGGAKPTLLFTSSGGGEYEVPVSIVPTPNQRPAEKTEVVLERVGTSGYLTRIWMQTRTTGYELGLPETAGGVKREPYKTIPASLFPPPGSLATEIEGEAHSVPPEHQREVDKPETLPRDPPVK